MSIEYFLVDERVEQIKDYINSMYGDDIVFCDKLITAMQHYTDEASLGRNNYYYSNLSFRSLLILCESGAYKIIDEYRRTINPRAYIEYVKTGVKREDFLKEE